MEEMLERLVIQLKKELAKQYTPKGYNGQVKTNVQYTKNNTSNLSDSISYRVESDIDTGEAKGVIIMDDYYYYVDQGRKPGSGTIGKGVKGWPPVNKIQQWVTQRGIRIPGLDTNAITYLIGKSIWMKGIGGIDFINNAIDNIIDEMIEAGEEEYADRFEEFIEEILVRSKSEDNIINI